MAWGKSDDKTAFAWRVMRLGSVKDDRLLNEAWGFVHRSFCWSAGAYADGFIPESIVLALAPGRGRVLIKAAQSAGLIGPRVTKHPQTLDPGWHLLLDVDELLHLRTKAEVQAEREWRALLRDPDTFLPVRWRDGDHCRYCGVVVIWKNTIGKRGGTLDHVIPGGNELVVACRRCNGAKQDNTLSDLGLTLQPPPKEPFYTQHTLDMFEKHGYTGPTARTHQPLVMTQPEAALARDQLEVETQQILARTTPAAETAAPARTGTTGDAAPNLTVDQARSRHGPAARGLPEQPRAGRDGTGQVGSGGSSLPVRAVTRRARGKRAKPPTPSEQESP
jgi:hypothetical protein